MLADGPVGPEAVAATWSAVMALRAAYADAAAAGCGHLTELASCAVVAAALERQAADWQVSTFNFWSASA